MQVNTQVKGTLAKLLATENLTVEHRRITTAYFDVEKRVLALPIWKNVSGDVYDLLVGHEVGHALYTPLLDFTDVPKDFVNVLEDARIERKMKVLYPGLRKCFYRGYHELNDQDFFGIKKYDVNKLSLIDRINLYFKIGIVDGVSIPFEDNELQWIHRAENTQTFDEVVELARDIWNSVQQNKQEKVDDIQPNNEGNSSVESDEYNPSSSQEVNGEQDSNGQGQEQSQVEDVDDSDEEEEGDDGEFNQNESVTDRAWRENQSSLVDDMAKEWIYIQTPQMNFDAVVVPWKTIKNDLETFFTAEENRPPRFSYQQHTGYVSPVQFTYNKYNEYKKSAIASVNYLVKQFEMKKSASAYHRNSTSRTGILDTNKLHSYKYNEDIFKKVSVIPDGKNHGLVMYIDWSGSMSDSIMDTLKQLYNLIWFCKKVNIPFRVYAFYAGNEYPDQSPVQLVEEFTLRMDNSFRLYEFFSNKMNAKTLDEQMRYVWAQAFACGRGGSYHSGSSAYYFGSTPLVEVACITQEVVKQFVSVEKIEKVNVVVLTDGESNPMATYTETKSDDDDYYSHRSEPIKSKLLCHNLNKVWILRDRKTGFSKKINPYPMYTTREIFNFFREITNYNWIGFRLCTKGELNQLLNNMELFDTTSYVKEWQDKRFTKITNSAGFTELFLMPNRYLGSGTEELEVVSKGDEPTKAELQRAFKKHMGSKMTNKTLLNAFVEQIV